jgi:hypothetical protein
MMEERPKLEFNPENRVEVYSLWEVLQGMPIENVLGKRSKLEQIGKRQVGKKQSSPSDGKRFFVQLWKDLGATCKDVCDDKVRMSFELFHQSFDEEGKKVSNAIKEQLSTYPGSYLLVSIFGVHSEKKQGDSTKNYYDCVASLLGVMVDNFLYIIQMAISDSLYTKATFGTGGDGASFRRRGLAKVLVGASQCLVRLLKGTDKIYANSPVTFNSFWASLGFIETCNDVFRNELSDVTLNALTTLARFTPNDETQHQFHTIDRPIDQFSLFGAEAEQNVLEVFRSPIFLEPVDYDEDEQNEWKLAKFFFVTDSSTTTTLSKDIMIKVPKVKIILDLWNLFKRSFEFYHLLNDPVEELQKITRKQFLIPEVFVDYCFL